MGVPLALRRRLVAEGCGTFWLVLLGCGTVASQGRFPGLGSGQLGVALAFGGALALALFLFGQVSGHFNPAVSFCLYLCGRLPAAELGLYAGAQCLGGLAAALLLRALTRAPSLGETTASVEWWRAFGLEALLTALLCLAVLRLTRKDHPAAAWAPLLIGATLFLAILAAGPLTGASLNPARSLGPALAGWTFRHLWIYLLAPLAGAWLASILEPRI